jgi:hypothetical protein
MIALAKAIEHARNMFIIQLREHIGLALKGADRLFLGLDAAKRIDHLSQSAFTSTQAQIFGEVDQFHAASAEGSDDAIPASN